MQIILVQSEVEDALKDYISSRLTIAPNTDIQIDLAATRGAEGVKAIIDLIPQTPTPTKPATATRKPAAVSKPKESEPVPAKPLNEPSVEPAAEVSTDAAETAQDEPTTVEATSNVNENGEAQPDEADEGTEAAAEPPATPPVRSLFANLRKPQNS